MTHLAAAAGTACHHCSKGLAAAAQALHGFPRSGLGGLAAYTNSMQSLRRLLRGFPKQRVLVAGDLMLDEQIDGKVDRISPEAPVPVVQISGHFYVPGGAANVAANIAALGAGVLLAGVIGDDEQGRQLAGLLKERGIEAKLLKDSDRPTITKTRVVAHGQQMLRLDRERQRHSAF